MSKPILNSIEIHTKLPIFFPYTLTCFEAQLVDIPNFSWALWSLDPQWLTVLCCEYNGFGERMKVVF